MEPSKENTGIADKIIEMGEARAMENEGLLYKSVIEMVERPLIEHVLRRVEGNQLKAARILGINRNTMRAKIRKLGIDTRAYKQ